MVYDATGTDPKICISATITLPSFDCGSLDESKHDNQTSPTILSSPPALLVLENVSEGHNEAILAVGCMIAGWEERL